MCSGSKANVAQNLKETVKFRYILSVGFSSTRSYSLLGFNTKCMKSITNDTVAIIINQYYRQTKCMIHFIHFISLQHSLFNDINIFGVICSNKYFEHEHEHGGFD